VPPINFGDKVRFYLNTAEYIARVRLIGNNKISDCGINILQFQFDQPVVAALHDRFIIRRLSPKTTIAGGKILDPNPPKIKKSDTAIIVKYKKFLIDDMEKNIRDFLDIYPYLSKGELVEKLHSEKVIAAVGNFYFSTDSLNRYIYNISETIRKFCFSKNFSGVAKPDILGRIDQNIANPLLDFMIDNGKLIEREGFIFLSEEQNLDQQFQQDLKKILQKIETAQYKFYNFSQLYSETGFEMDYFQQLINYLKSQNQLIVLDKGYLITKKLIEKAKRRITHYLITNSGATVTELKQILNTTRKFIFPVLRYFDGNFLERKGDYRILK
jgi:selenocysteine-specific elongation factor